MGAEREAVSVVEMNPPLCECGKPLTTRDELNRRIDAGMDICDACMDVAEETTCWCVYGWFISGDPRLFEPDAENQPTDIAAWRLACQSWERGEMVNPVVEEHGPWVEPGTGRVTLGERPSPDAIGHCSAPRAYGLGAIYCAQHPPALDAWKQWPRRHDDESQIGPHGSTAGRQRPESPAQVNPPTNGSRDAVST